MEFLQASNLSENFKPDGRLFDMDGRMPCDMSAREMTVIDEDVAVLDDGRLVMFGQENRTTGGVHGRLTFTSPEYCIDRVSLVDGITVNAKATTTTEAARTTTTTTTTSTASTTTAEAAAANGSRINSSNGTSAAVNNETLATYTYVALVCRPCSRMTCVPKCCGKGLMLAYQKNNKNDVIGCRKVQSVVNATAAIHMKFVNGTELRRECPFPTPLLLVVVVDRIRLNSIGHCYGTVLGIFFPLYILIKAVPKFKLANFIFFTFHLIRQRFVYAVLERVV